MRDNGTICFQIWKSGFGLAITMQFMQCRLPENVWFGYLRIFGLGIPQESFDRISFAHRRSGTARNSLKYNRLGLGSPETQGFQRYSSIPELGTR